MEGGERRSAFVRTVLDHLGKDGWELAGLHPLWPAETSYMIFKRPASGAPPDQAAGASESHEAAENAKGAGSAGEPTRDIGDKPAGMV